MRFALPTSLIALATAAFAQSADDYVKSEGPIAKAGLLANIGPDGSKSSGAKVSMLRTVFCCSLPPEVACRT